MSHTTTFIGRQADSAPSGALAYVLRAASRFARSWKRRRQLAHLAGLDDHLLADIGLIPDDVSSTLPFSACKTRLEFQPRTRHSADLR